MSHRSPFAHMTRSEVAIAGVLLAGIAAAVVVSGGIALAAYAARKALRRR